MTLPKKNIGWFLIPLAPIIPNVPDTQNNPVPDIA